MSMPTTPDGAQPRAVVEDLNFDHRSARGCPICGADMRRVALVEIGYTFEICYCDAAPYDHLAEQPWHRRCLGGALVAQVSQIGGGGS